MHCGLGASCRVRSTAPSGTGWMELGAGGGLAYGLGLFLMNVRLWTR